MAVIRSYTYKYTTRGIVDVPYQCSSCRLSTVGHIETVGVGTMTTVLVHPDEAAAQRAAHEDLAAKGKLAVDACPCPRCGGASDALVAAMAAYDAKYPGGRRGRRISAFLTGASVSAAIALSCIASMLLFPTKGSTAGDMVGAALCGGSFLFVVGAAVSGAVSFFLSPAERPAKAAVIAPAIRFDPPRT